MAKFLSSTLVFGYKSTLLSILKGNNCGSLPSVNRDEPGTTISKQLENHFLKTCTLVLCVFLPPLHPQQCAFFGYFESVGFFYFCLSYGEYSECPLWKEAIGCWSVTGCCASIKKGFLVTEGEGNVACYPAADQELEFPCTSRRLLQNLVETYLKVNSTTFLITSRKIAWLFDS